MLSFFRRRAEERKMCTRIGVELHRQISSAFERSEERTSVRLPSAYTAAFVPAFVETAFARYSATDGADLANKYRRKICDGVLPNRLNEVIARQGAAYDLAANLPDRPQRQGSAGPSPSQLRALYEQGVQDGRRDAAAFAGEGQSLDLLVTFLTK